MGRAPALPPVQHGPSDRSDQGDGPPAGRSDRDARYDGRPVGRSCVPVHRRPGNPSSDSPSRDRTRSDRLWTARSSTDPPSTDQPWIARPNRARSCRVDRPAQAGPRRAPDRPRARRGAPRSPSPAPTTLRGRRCASPVRPRVPAPPAAATRRDCRRRHVASDCRPAADARSRGRRRLGSFGIPPHRSSRERELGAYLPERPQPVA